MKDFPVFTTENGVASLKFKEIPYSGAAYITLQDSQKPETLLAECVDFSRAVGATSVYASGHPILENYPLYTHILSMRASRDRIADTDAVLFPVTGDTLEFFRKFYNERMCSVANASYMDLEDGRQLLGAGCGYFVHRDGHFLGIAIGSGERIHAVASKEKGAGETIVRAICHTLTGDSVELDVASSNQRAVRLYERMGFCKTGLIASWYKII